MLTKAEILQIYRQTHDALTNAFYVDKTIDKTMFQAQHDQCNSDRDAALLANGFLVKKYQYAFGAQIVTAVGTFNVQVVITSPIQLTPAQIANNVDKLKTADWQLVISKEDLVES